MRAIVNEALPQAWIEERRRLGLDRRDEMWEGVLHLNPVPGPPHQELRDDLHFILRTIGQERNDRGKWHTENNLMLPGGWPGDYRIPDLLYLGPRSAVRRTTTHLVGPPEIVVEIAGPDDESREKLPWYARLGVPELWFLAVSDRSVEILLLSRGEYLKQRPSPSRWFASELFPVELRSARRGKRKVLEIRAAGESGVRARL